MFTIASTETIKMDIRTNLPSSTCALTADKPPQASRTSISQPVGEIMAHQLAQTLSYPSLSHPNTASSPARHFEVDTACTCACIRPSDTKTVDQLALAAGRLILVGTDRVYNALCMGQDPALLQHLWPPLPS
eukprot:425457-Hanusia_phi.AAC.2